jgi:hypothetical protein
LTKALAKLAKAVTLPDLRAAFETHGEETLGQIERLEQVFASLDAKVSGKHCDGKEEDGRETACGSSQGQEQREAISSLIRESPSRLGEAVDFLAANR